MIEKSKEAALIRDLKRVKTMNYVLMVFVAIIIVSIIYQQFTFSSINAQTSNTINSINLKLSNISSLKNVSIPVSNNQSFGSRLTNIDKPLNATELSIINNAPNNYFEIAGQRLLNGTLNDSVFYAVNSSNVYNSIMINGKPSVIYIGAVSCMFCAEKRWAMALALSRFGNFSSLYKGYSSFGDQDFPTLYWSKYNYTIPAGVAYGNSYNSKYINFISADYESPIRQGFEIQPLSFFVKNAPNATYRNVMEFMNSTNKFEGTPFTMWGHIMLQGADAVVLGNSMPTSPPFALTFMTHEQVFSQIHNFNDQFSWSEYAAADVYVAYICNSINNTATVCSLPSIRGIETAME